MRNGTLSHELCDGNKNEKMQGGTNMKRKMVSVALCAAMTAGVLAGGAVTVSAEDKLVVYGIYKPAIRHGLSTRVQQLRRQSKKQAENLYM